jgi:hypothetical protein
MRRFFNEFGKLELLHYKCEHCLVEKSYRFLFKNEIA